MGLTAKSQLCSSGSTLSGDSLQACSLLRWSSALGHDAIEAMLGPLCKQPDNKQYISDDKAHHPMAMREVCTGQSGEEEPFVPYVQHLTVLDSFSV